MPRTLPDLPPHLVRRFRRRYALEGAKRLLDHKIHAFRPSEPAVQLKTDALGEMLLASLKRYTQDQDGFGSVSGSFDAYAKPFFDCIYANEGAPDRAKLLLEGIDSADRILHRLRERSVPHGAPRTSGAAEERFDGLTRGQFVATVGQDRTLDQALRDLHRTGLLQPELLLNDLEKEVVRYRRIVGLVREVKCNQQQEKDIPPKPGDEIYILTSASVFDVTGTFESAVGVSDVTEGVHTGDPVPLTPPEATRILDYKIVDPPDDLGIAPLYVVVTVTVVEQEFSDVEKMRAAAEAAVSAVKLMAAAVSGNLLGAVAALKDLMMSLAVLLDKDDVLGTVSYQAEDVLTGPAIEETITDVANDDDAEYQVTLTLTTDNVLGSAPRFRVVGDQNLRTSTERAAGHYAIDMNTQIEPGSVKWMVTPPQDTSIRRQGQTSTVVDFLLWGNYTVSAKATQVGNGPELRDEARVSVVFDADPGGRTRVR